MDLKDIYFTDNYCKIYEDNGDGELKTFVLDEEEGVIVYKFLKRKIPLKIGDKVYFDITTPYGYGGPLIIQSNNVERLVQKFKIRFEKYCKDNNIITEFVRFHPLLKNYSNLNEYMEIKYIRDTIAIRLEDEEQIWNDIDPKCKNKIRKAQKNNVNIDICEDETYLEEFLHLYDLTMRKNNALEYYFFNKEFFLNTFKNLRGNIYNFRSIYNDKCICSALIMKYGKYIHYHFSGSALEYKNLQANNLLLYEVALWGLKQGCEYFHLGGGYSGNEDNLFKFKSSFSKNGRTNFFIGKKIHNQKLYDLLVEKKRLEHKIINVSYFPLYRG